MNKHALRVTTLLVTAALAQYAHASGFQFSSQSAASQATANSSAAEAADASTISYNPAGLTYLDGTQFSGTLTVVAPSIEAKNATGRTLPSAAAPTGNAIAGRSNDKIGDPAAAPHTYFSSRVNDRMSMGVGIYVPFGSGTEYEKDSVLRYNVNQTHLAVIAINPAVAFKLTPTVSVGFGVVAQHAEAELRQYANFAGALARVYAAQAAAGVAGAAQAAAAAVAQDGKGPLDGYAEIKGDDWGFGFNFGAMWDVTDSTRVGFNYRSKVKHELAGSADWTMPSTELAKSLGATPILENVLGYTDSPASVKVTTPESYSLHIMHKFSPALRMYADVSRTNHSSFTSADVQYATPKITINQAVKATYTRLNPNWKDTTKVAVGGSYQMSEPLQLRFGIAHDKSPVPSANDRLSTLPDSDRSWLSMGAKYAWSKSLVLDAAYTYIHIKDASANVNGYCGGTSPAAAPATAVNCVSSYTTGRVDFESSAHLVGLQASYRF